MKQMFKPGDTRHFSRIVTDDDAATFDSGQVHPAYATFALGRDAEWTCRMFVLEMKEEQEEGIGTFLTIHHHSPALTGSKVDFTSELIAQNGNELICRFSAKVGNRLIATGEQGQKILPKDKLKEIFSGLNKAGSSK
jgi:fluoroacetyl-CoA thioesterase